eukprot:Skav200158  [mRNA]  locus=scaffold4148:53634:56050:+ [translate_table: standard]
MEKPLSCQKVITSVMGCASKASRTKALSFKFSSTNSKFSGSRRAAKPATSRSPRRLLPTKRKAPGQLEIATSAKRTLDLISWDTA